MSEEKQYRQGDLLFVKRDIIPKHAKKRSSQVIVAGEVTGHVHELEHGSIFDLRTGWHPRVHQVFIAAEDGARVVHDEHPYIALEAGVWEVIRQREYGKAQESRQVSD